VAFQYITSLKFINSTVKLVLTEQFKSKALRYCL